MRVGQGARAQNLTRRADLARPDEGPRESRARDGLFINSSKETDFEINLLRTLAAEDLLLYSSWW